MNPNVQQVQSTSRKQPRQLREVHILRSPDFMRSDGRMSPVGKERKRLMSERTLQLGRDACMMLQLLSWHP